MRAVIDIPNFDFVKWAKTNDISLDMDENRVPTHIELFMRPSDDLIVITCYYLILASPEDPCITDVFTLEQYLSLYKLGFNHEIPKLLNLRTTGERK
jgi:hypothetical protein